MKNFTLDRRRLFNDEFKIKLAYILEDLWWVKSRFNYYLNNWVYTTNHKRIAMNYFWFIVFSGLCGMVLATIIRLEMAYPGPGILAGDSLQYLSVVTAHGVIMVFFMIMPLLFGAFSNFLLPTQMGVHDVAFPRLNSAAFWFLPAGLIMLCQLVCIDRRYHRINCFNFKEIESLLKQKYSYDMLSDNLYTTELNKSVLHLNYRLPVESKIEHNILKFHTYNLKNTLNLKYFNIYEYDTTLTTYKDYRLINYFFKNLIFKIVTRMYFILLNSQPSNYQFKTLPEGSNLFKTLIFYITSPFRNDLMLDIFNLLTFASLRLRIKTYIYTNNPTLVSFLLNKSWSFIYYGLYVAYYIWATIIYYWAVIWYNVIMYNTKCVSYYAFTGVVTYIDSRMPDWLGQLSKPNVVRYVRVTAFIRYYCRWYWAIFGEATLELFDIIYYATKFIHVKPYFFTKEFMFNIKTNKQTTLDDGLFGLRFLLNENPIFKYDYKAGTYCLEIYMQLYPHTLNSFDQTFGGFKKADWFNSESFNDLFNKFTVMLFNTSLHFDKGLLGYYNNNMLSYFDIFYVIWFHMTLNPTSLNNRWVNFKNLENKFSTLFLNQTIQQRVFNNWRSFKFTRESWRCRLLIARHQKTLYKRYTKEDNLIWAIERNAKDLLPGWAMITPFSARTRYTVIGKTDIGLMAVLLTITASIINSTNFLITYRYLSTLNNRKMRDSRCFFTEGVIVASWMMIAANPMLMLAIIMLLFDRHWRTSFFDYSGGGDTILFQHMFWFFGHPEVYIIIIPCFGFTNTILAYYLRKRISARASLIYSMYTIAVLGFFVWGHHMYMVGLAHTTRMLYSTLTVMISVPAATKLMHWMVTFVNSSIHTELPLYFVLIFIFFFITGGISGMFVAHTGMDVLFHDTLYVVGHFHVMLAGSAMFASFGAFYFYFPALIGVKYSRLYAYLHFIYYLIGQLLTVTPMIWLGYAGMPRRVLDYPVVMGGWHSIVSGGHILSVGGSIAFFIVVYDSIYKGRAIHRTTLGIGRYNTRLNFYLYEISRLHYLRSKQNTLLRLNYLVNNENSLNFKHNLEIYETILVDYTIKKRVNEY